MSTEEAEVRELILRRVAEFNSGDYADIVADDGHPGTVNGFAPRGSLLWEQEYTEEAQAEWKAWYDAGYKPNIELRHLNVKVYGNASVATGYQVGSYTFPGGRRVEGTWRYTEVRVKHDGQWKFVHSHVSALAPEQRETSA